MSARGVALKRFRYAAGLSAPVYLLALFLLRERIPGGVPFLLSVAIGPLAAAYFFVAYLLARKRDDRVPDLLPLLVWGAAAAMEIHAFVPPVARTGVVPAALFFGLALKFPPTLSIPAILCVDAWLAAVPGPIEKEIFYTSAMALIAGGAGIAVRGGYRKGGREVNGVQEAIARSRALVLPWEDSGNGGLPASGEMTEESSLLRREEELKDGIRQALDRLLGLTGASHVAYIARSASPGSVLHEGFLLSRGSPVSREISLPDTYVPLREATVFRKPFLEVGPGARRYAPWKSGPGSAPAGVAAVPVFRDGVVEGVLLAVRDEEGPWRDPVIPAMELAGHFVGRDIERMRELHQGDRYYLRGEWYHSMVRKMAEVGTEEDPEPGGGVAFEAGDGLRGDRGTGPPAGRRGQGPSGRIRRGPGERSRRLGGVAGGRRAGAGWVRTARGQLRRVGDPYRDAAHLSRHRRPPAKPGCPSGIVGEGGGAVVPGPAGGGEGGVSGRPGLRPPAGETVPETARGDRAGHHKGHAARAFPRRTARVAHEKGDDGRVDRAVEPEGVSRAAGGGSRAARRSASVRRRDAGHRPLQEGQRHLRAPVRRRGAAGRGVGPRQGSPQGRHGGAVRRGGVRALPPHGGHRAGPGGRREVSPDDPADPLRPRGKGDQPSPLPSASRAPPITGTGSRSS